MNELKNAEAGKFDERYIEMQVDAHENAVSLFENYAEDGDNAALCQFSLHPLWLFSNDESPWAFGRGFQPKFKRKPFFY